MRSTTLPATVAALAACLLLACADEERRPVGASCQSAGQCETTICGGGVCLSPSGDEDGDGLINATEAALGTDPANADTDGDGLDDATEVGDPTTPADEDLDGKIDAIESLVNDCDEDGLVDQQDPDDGTDATGRCLASCLVRDEALPLEPNTTTEGELPLGETQVHAVPVLEGTVYTVRLGHTSMESNPDLRIFLSGLALCQHAILAEEMGLANADEAAPPHFVSTEDTPGNHDETDVIVDDPMTSTLYLRVDGASETPAGYALSTAPSPVDR